MRLTTRLYSMRNISTINPVTMENTGEIPTQPQGSHIMLSRINILSCQRKELEHKGGQRQVHDVCRGGRV